MCPSHFFSRSVLLGHANLPASSFPPSAPSSPLSITSSHFLATASSLLVLLSVCMSCSLHPLWAQPELYYGMRADLEGKSFMRTDVELSRQGFYLYESFFEFAFDWLIKSSSELCSFCNRPWIDLRIYWSILFFFSAFHHFYDSDFTWLYSFCPFLIYVPVLSPYWHFCLQKNTFKKNSDCRYQWGKK